MLAARRTRPGTASIVLHSDAVRKAWQQARGATLDNKNRGKVGYLYENSNSERFQHFCQSLLAPSFPKLQCFPVGQPDGGRDGWDPETKTVLQVKFKRADEEDNVEWLITALNKELPKIRTLAERGAEQYIMATNARGTAHLSRGRIDIVQKWFDDNLPIPGTCFWRDDLDRRFDAAATSLKLKYSEMLSLEDGIDVALGAVLGTRTQRQQDAIRAFIVAQFQADRTVKFKQVSLSNDLLDLFIDVPVGFPRRLFDRATRAQLPTNDLHAFILAWVGSGRAYLEAGSHGGELFVGSASGRSQRLRLGAAELVLSDAAENHLRLIVLEGAPGQGKSTLAQYACQIHRARYLKKQHIVDRVPEAHKQTAFRVPIKVDLRDYAAFLEGNSPFATTSQASEPRTFDVFLSQLIAHTSGGIAFNAHDVLMLLRNAPALLFLDGLDEVADLTVREALVASLGDALARWNEFDADLQVVVTSRPSVFGRAPSLEKLGFVTLNLQNIEPSRVNEYADKWVSARGLDESEKRDVKKILAEKLELAHIRDVTRNPMQLTILLSLIHQVGHSLPDQRTDLYDRYVDLFLTREADKSARVREHRQVLLGFIQHLAWVLQAEAESSRSAGSVSAAKLQSMARDYLRDRGHAVEIADDLFGGGLERIFVLVERIEGLYEFEVQPLREFFCAQHLYSTAPVGTYRDKDLRGDRAQRFEALAANPLWLNVCRFYAGACERGETGTLVLSLEEMIQTGALATAVHARRVGLALLQDWVLSNVKYPQDQLIHAILAGAGLDILLGGEGRASDDMVLDRECGQKTLRDSVFRQLDGPLDARAFALCQVLRANGGQHLTEEFQELLQGASGAERSAQISRMLRAGATSELAVDAIWDLIVEDEPSQSDLRDRVAEVVRVEPESAVRIPQLLDCFVQGVLAGLITGVGQPSSPLGTFADLLGNSPHTYVGLRRLNGIDFYEEGKSGISETKGLPRNLRTFVDRTTDIPFDPRDDSFDARNSPQVWAFICESARESFGDTWATMAIAIRTAGIKGGTDLPSGAESLFDTTVPLCARARYARLRRGGITWWTSQLQQASTTLDRMLWAGLVLMWSSPSNLFALASKVNDIVESLSEDQYEALRHTLEGVAAVREPRSDRKRQSTIDLRRFSNSAAVLVAVAFKADSSALQYASGAERVEPLGTFLRVLNEFEGVAELPTWKDKDAVLAWAKHVHRLRSTARGAPSGADRHSIGARLSSEVAEAVLREPRLYPAELVARAVQHLQRRYRPKALAAVSSEQNWAFD